MNTYRVFVTRHYIECEFYDVEAPDEKEAGKAAVKAAKHYLPDVRSSAVDNGWIVEHDEVTRIPYLGHAANDMPVAEIERRTSKKGTSIVYHTLHDSRKVYFE